MRKSIGDNLSNPHEKSWGFFICALFLQRCAAPDESLTAFAIGLVVHQPAGIIFRFPLTKL